MKPWYSAALILIFKNTENRERGTMSETFEKVSLELLLKLFYRSVFFYCDITPRKKVFCGGFGEALFYKKAPPHRFHRSLIRFLLLCSRRR